MKQYKPITPGSRHRLIIKSIKFKPFKPLMKGLNKTGFRNNYGRITIRHRGGGSKVNYRYIDINRINSNYSPFMVVRIEKDPNRTTFIALCKTLHHTTLKGANNGTPITSVRIKGFKYFYILAPHNITAGTIIDPQLITIGTSLPLTSIPLGSLIHNVQFKGLSTFARSAGTFCTVIAQSTDFTSIKLPSNKVIDIPNTNKATLGIASNINNNKISLGKAGASRWLGRRPVVRGEVMNPIDHPHGGKTRGGKGRPVRNIWGKLAKWVPTAKAHVH